MTSSSTWWRVPVPVRPDRLLVRWYPWPREPTSPVAATNWKASGSTARCVMPARCVPSACPPDRTSGAPCGCIPRNRCCREARALQQSPAFTQYRRRRVVAEHRLARLVQLGIRQARYFGRAKTNFQLYLATTVANISLLTDKIGLTGDSDPGYPDFINVADAGANYSGHLPRNPRWALTSLVTAW